MASREEKDLWLACSDSFWSSQHFMFKKFFWGVGVGKESKAGKSLSLDYRIVNKLMYSLEGVPDPLWGVWKRELLLSF